MYHFVQGALDIKLQVHSHNLLCHLIELTHVIDAKDTRPFPSLPLSLKRRKGLDTPLMPGLR